LNVWIGTSNHRIIGPLGHRLIEDRKSKLEIRNSSVCLRVPPSSFEFRFFKPAHGLIFLPETVDIRCGGVRAAGLIVNAQASPPFRLWPATPCPSALGPPT